ncbi:zinc finger protein 814-like [Sitodiplosis mosellana]|uniref:zinc finger protein 814-like n=1 Tax=Sitodiplosis mosellana TaxID=263140 RepID=UPI002444FEF9|nr:zinc finger protein 814-like [Sitodiplosis mosellana]
MIQIKDEPVDELADHEVRYRDGTSEIEDGANYYQFETIRDQVRAIWGEEDDDVKPKIEPIEVDPNRQPVINLDSAFLRKNYRVKWIELVKSTFRRPNNKNACQLCKKPIEFDSATKLIEHYAEQHQKLMTSYDCTLCDFSGKHTQEIHDHWSEKHKRQHKYDTKYTIEKKTNDRNNIWIGDDELIYSFYKKEIVECDICSKKMQRRLLKGHKADHTGDRFKCKYCHKIFRQQSNLNTHMMAVHMYVPRTECKICWKTFTSRGYLRIHMKSHSKNTAKEHREGDYECDICSEKVLQKDKLERHMQWHMKNKAFLNTEQKKRASKKQIVECDYCLKKLERCRLSDHKKRCRNERRFECDICGKIFIWKCDLKYHILATHVKVKQFKCEICSKAFSSKGHLTRHELIHLKDTLPRDDPRIKRHNYEHELVECEICSKRLQRVHLKGHIKLHTDEKPFQCDICHKSFKTKQNVRKHKVRHTDEQPFECSFCSQKFKTQRNQRNHELVHRNEQPHACPFCNKKFLFNQDFHMHFRSVHFNLLRQQDRLTGGLNDLFQGYRTYECYKCKYPAILRQVTAHLRGCRVGSTFLNCPMCIRKFKSKARMEGHLKRTHFT